MTKELQFQRVEVPNNGFMSDQPTNGFIIGTNEVILIDPGDEPGAEMFLTALAERGNPTVRSIVLTHSHPDHAVAAARLKRELGVPVMLNPKERPVLEQFKGLTWDDIDQELHGGMTIEVDGGELEAIDTPGHSPGHIALFERSTGRLIAGDLVSGHGTVGIFPPHGRMIEYFNSLRAAEALHPNVVYPGHGPTITEPQQLFQQYIDRRSQREREIVNELRSGPKTIEQIVTPLYPDVLPHFRRAAGATVLAHLIKLDTEGRVAHDRDDLVNAVWSLRE